VGVFVIITYPSSLFSGNYKEVPLSHSVNCTVAFMSKCMSAHKCKMSCRSMGAAKYRWTHHEGCCQCIGETCIDYGYNKPLCLLCRGDDNDQLVDTELVDDDEDEEIEKAAQDVSGDSVGQKQGTADHVLVADVEEGLKEQVMRHGVKHGAKDESAPDLK